MLIVFVVKEGSAVNMTLMTLLKFLTSLPRNSCLREKNVPAIFTTIHHDNFKKVRNTDRSSSVTVFNMNKPKEKKKKKRHNKNTYVYKGKAD